MSEEPVVLPIEDSLDLHTFHPRDVPSLVPEYLEACRAKGILQVRIIHGKGKGFLREKVHAALRRLDWVESFNLADREGGDWGSTTVILSRLPSVPSRQGRGDSTGEGEA